MNAIVERIGREALIGAAVGFIVGLIIGLPILGWWLWPVRWVDTDPYDLKQRYKEAYIAMLADSYAFNRDAQLAKERAAGWDKEELCQIIAKLESRASEEERQRLDDLAGALELKVEIGKEAIQTPVGATPPPVERPPSPVIRRLVPVLGIFLAMVLFIAAAVAIVMIWRGRGEAIVSRWVPPSTEPLGHFVARYTLGQDDYDESLDIESPTGELLGECGLSIAETLGTGAPAKVTAFNLSLFDRSDVRTVTKVLMSEYAYGDEAIRNRLAIKGEPVLVEPGKRIELETQSLRVEARVIEAEYGDGGPPFTGGTIELLSVPPARGGEVPPPNSYFTKLSVELTAWVKA